MKISVLGDGGWGTAIAILLAKKRHEIFLWGAFEDYVEFLNKKRENIKFLPSVKIPQEITISSNLEQVLKNTALIVLAVPSHFMREVVRRLKGYNLSQSVVLSVAKGIENETLMRMSEIIVEEINPLNLAVLSGPSHAEEVVKNLPTAVAVSSLDQKVALRVQDTFTTERFRVYTTPDIIGVELGGALKNIVAVAAGISDGLGFGANTKAALLSRGIIEMTRLGVESGARPATFNGLSGIGDLIATCISPYSRNRQIGTLIAQGKKLDQILKEMEMVAEGIKTTRSVHDLALERNIEVPITKGIYSILYEDTDPLSVVRDLMLRRAKPEGINGIW